MNEQTLETVTPLCWWKGGLENSGEDLRPAFFQMALLPVLWVLCRLRIHTWLKVLSLFPGSPSYFSDVCSPHPQMILSW